MNIYFLGMCVSFAIYLIISFFVSKKVKTTNDFFVAGRNAPLILIVGSMIASYVSTGMFMGDAGEYYSGLFSPMTILATMQVVGYIYGAVFFGRYLRRSEVLTIPDFFGKRFCSEKVRVLSIVISIITSILGIISCIMEGSVEVWQHVILWLTLLLEDAVILLFVRCIKNVTVTVEKKENM